MEYSQPMTPLSESTEEMVPDLSDLDCFDFLEASLSSSRSNQDDPEDEEEPTFYEENDLPY